MKILPVTSPTATVSSTGWHATAVRSSRPALVKFALWSNDSGWFHRMGKTDNKKSNKFPHLRFPTFQTCHKQFTILDDCNDVVLVSGHRYLVFTAEMIKCRCNIVIWRHLTTTHFSNGIFNWWSWFRGCPVFKSNIPIWIQVPPIHVQVARPTYSFPQLMMLNVFTLTCCSGKRIS